MGPRLPDATDPGNTGLHPIQSTPAPITSAKLVDESRQAECYSKMAGEQYFKNIDAAHWRKFSIDGKFALCLLFY